TAQEAGAECRKAAWPAASLARRGGQGRPQDHADCTGLRSWSRRLLVGALASCTWGGGACDPSLECRRIARTSPGEDRPARHRVTEAGVLGVAAWGTGPLHHGAHPDNCRRGRQAAQSRARVPGQGTHAHRQPNEGDPRPGIRNFKPTLRKAAERVTTLHTPEGSALPPNVSAELQRNMARLG